MGIGGALAELFVSLTLKDEMSAPLEDAGKKTVGVGQRMKDLAPAAMAAGAALTGIGAVATGLIDGNRAMDASFKTTALSMGVSETSVKDLARGLQSVDSPIEEVAATLDVLARAGMTNVDSMGQTASAFDTLADATGQNADSLTDQMVPAFKALGIPLEAAPGQIDGLATMFRKSNVDIGDFSKVMTKVGPDLGEMGVGLEDVEAIMMSFADRGITGKKATAEFAEAVKNSGGSTDGLYKALGMTAEEVAKYSGELENSEGAAARFAEAQNSSFGVMDQLTFELDKVKQGLGDALKPFEGLATAAMGVGPALTGVSAGVGLLGSETAQKLIPGLGKASEALGSGGGLMGALKGAGSGLLTFATGPIGIAILAIAAIGAGILLLDQRFHFIEPTLKWFGEIFAGIGDWLGKTFGPILDGVIGYIGELFGVMDTGKGPIEDILGAFKTLGEWIGKTGAAIGEVLGPAIQAAATWIGQTFGPALKTLFGILKEIAGFIVDRLIKNVQLTFGILQTVAGWLVQTFGPAVEKGIGVLIDIWPGITAAIGAAWKTITDVIMGAWSWICGLFSGKSGGGGFDLVGIMAGIWSAIQGGIAGAWGLIKTALGAALDGLIWLIKSYISAYTAAMGAIWSAIGAAVGAAWELVKGALGAALDGLIWLIKSYISAYTAAVGLIWSGIQAAVGAAWGLISGAVAAAVEAVKGAMIAVFNTHVAAVGAVWSAIQSAASSAWSAISGAVVAGVEVLKNTAIGVFNAYKAAIDVVWSAIKGAAETAWNAIKGAVVAIVEGLKAAAVATVTALQAWLSSAWSTIKSTAEGAWTALKGAVSAIVEGLKAAISSTITALQGVLSSAWSAIKSTAETTWNALKAAVASIVDALKSTISSTIEGLKTLLSTAWSTIKSTAETAWTNLKNSVVSIFDGLKNAIANTKDAFVSAVGAIWSAINGAVAGAWNTIKASVSSAVDRVKGIFAEKQAAFVGAIGAIWSAIAGAVPGAFSVINSAVSSAMGKVASTFTKALDGLKSAWSSFVSWLSGQQVTAPSSSTPPSGSGDSYTPPTTPGMSAAEYASRAAGPSPNFSSYANNAADLARYQRDLAAWKEEYARQLAIAKSKGYLHAGGIYDAPGGRSEGYAFLQTGERVLSRPQTAEYDGGLLSAVRELSDLIRSGGLGGGDTTYFPNAVIREEVDVDRLLARIRAAEANDALKRGKTRGRAI